MTTAAGRVLCHLGRHDKVLVVVADGGYLWLAHDCRRCPWQSIGIPLDHRDASC